MVKTIEITKASVRGRLIVDAKVFMKNPQDFDFSPGIDVTDIYQIKGLEYDYIILLEPTATHYPDTTEARHLLHVAMTRAAHQLWLLCSDRPSPLLPESLVQSQLDEKSNR